MFFMLSKNDSADTPSQNPSAEQMPVKKTSIETAGKLIEVMIGDVERARETA
jgi:hypothetical protein